MPCYKPLRAWLIGGAVRFQYSAAGESLRLPCGRCIGCRLERSRQWAVRCMHEASLWEENAFVTLTLDDEHVPPDGGLDVRTFQLFVKRLRKRRAPARFRYFHSGEYGELNGRPHYHALLFNVGFPDRTPWARRGEHPTYRSQELEETWGLGHAEIGEVTFESAAYVARYCVKKITGDPDAYKRFNAFGEEVEVQPEYATQSQGIGGPWFEQYATEVYPRDRVVVRGREAKPPRYYDKRLSRVDPLAEAELRAKRARECRLEDQTEERLEVRGEVASVKYSLFSRRSL